MHIKVICEISNKHCHLTKQTLAKTGLTATKLRDVSQPGQWASNEKFSDGVDEFRIIMPERDSDQFELSLTDWIKRFGREREPAWKRGAEPGYVVTLRHLHISEGEAEKLGLKDGGFVSIEKDGVRAGRLDKVLVRVSPHFKLRVHLDTDEANALYIKNGEEITVVW